MTATPEPVLRARRVEVVDDDGRARVVIGDLGGEGREWVFGIALLDEAGRHRAWLELGSRGAGLGFDRDGNVVVEVGVDDDHPEVVSPGAFVHLADADGRPRVQCRVDGDGHVVLRRMDDDHAVEVLGSDPSG